MFDLMNFKREFIISIAVAPYLRDFKNLAGTPPKIVLGGTLETTAEFAAMIAPEPIVTPDVIVQLAATQTSSLIQTGRSTSG